MLDDTSLLPAPQRRIDLPAARSGYVRSLAAWPIGQATMLLGAGREVTAPAVTDNAAAEAAAPASTENAQA